MCGIMNAKGELNMRILNPYRPGAGLMPGVLAGREELIADATERFDALIKGIPMQSIALSGYRGVGKTVLINKLQEIAGEMGISCYHIEAERNNSFVSKLSDCSRKFIRQNSLAAKFAGLVDSALDAIKALEITYSPSDNNVSISMRDMALYKNSDLSQGLQDLFAAIGELAKKKETAICFFIDEFQYVEQDEISAFVSALHRANQLGYLVMAICAGTPEMLKKLYKEKTYAERQFIFPKLDMLDKDAVAYAIEVPGKKVGLTFDGDALEEIYKITKGYPYFVQQYGQILCNKVNEDKHITINQVRDIVDQYYTELDKNFYMIRFEDRGALEKECLIAIASAKSLPCDSYFVAKQTNRTKKQVAPTLSRLKNKGLITYDDDNTIDFTVP